MKSIYFKNSNDVGFEVATANDVIKAQELGLYICNKDEDYFNSYVTELDEDGNETEREATKDERTERMIKALREGQHLYATFNFDNSGMRAVKDSATILASDFYVGQTVYTMQDNKIVSGTILYLSLSQSKDKKEPYIDVRATHIVEVVYNYCATQSNNYCSDFWNLTPTHKQEVRELVCKSLNDNSVVLCIENRNEARNMSEIFATKEELINSLLNK